MPETIVLDPSEVAASGRSELNINSGAIEVRQEGIDWGTAEVQAAMAQAVRGETVVDYRIPNRQVQIPLVMKTVGTATFTNARDQLSTKVARIQAEGGWIKRVTSQGGTYFGDVVNASINVPGGWLQQKRDIETDVVLTLEVLPDWYQAEATLSDHTETSAAEITFTETTSAGGDFPLGDRVRVVVDEDDGDNQRGLFWSFRARHYSSATTAASAYEAEALTILDTATRVAKTGASNGSMVTHGTLLTSWTPVLGTNLTAGSYLTHTGTNRIFARVFSTAGTAVQARFVYDVGDFVYPTENPPRRLYNAGTFHILDLGEARLDRLPTGSTHRWQGQIQAAGNAGTENFSVDRIWIANQDESAGMLSLAPESMAGSPTSFTGRDNFTQGTANLHGLSATVGGAWDTTETNFDGVDFVVPGSASSPVAARRPVTSDVAYLGRPALLGSAVAACGVQCDVMFSSLPISTMRLAVMARYVDSNNYLIGHISPFSPQSSSYTGVIMRLAGTNIALAGPTTADSSINFSSPYYGLSNYWYGLRLTVDAAGNFAFSIAFIGGGGSSTADSPGGAAAYVLIASGSRAELATSGALASGKSGFYDENQTAAITTTRYYDNFSQWSPADNAIMFASQSLELATTGVSREDSAGAVFVPVPGPVGDLPRMPNRSSAGTVEFMAKASRGDLQTLADPGIDDISARIYRRPSFLTPD